MSKEIVDAIHVLEQEKGISADMLMDALADALLSAYKKSPGSARYARVDIDHESGDFIVWELLLPEELEERAARRGRGGARGADRRPRDGRAARARGARDPAGGAGRALATRSRSATSRPTTSAASPPRRRSR